MATIRSALEHKSASKELKGGSLATIFAYEDIVVKSYQGSHQRGFAKLKGEIKYLNSVPQPLHKYFPPVVEYEIKDDHIAFSVPYYSNMQSISAHVLSNSDIHAVWDVLKVVLSVTDEHMYTLFRTENTKGYIEATQFARAESALSALCGMATFRGLVTTRRVYLNGEQLVNFGELFDKVRNDSSILRLISPNYLSYFHGNFHTDNILTDLKDFILIDPRGETIGTPDYDKSKMFVHLYVRYDEIHYDLFELTRYGSTDYDIFLTDCSVGSRYNYLQRMFFEYELQKRGTDLSWLDKMLVLGAIHALSFASYHARKEKPNISRVEAYYLSGLKLLNDYFNKNKISRSTSLLPYKAIAPSIG